MQIDKHAARELVLYCENTERVYTNILNSANHSLSRRIRNGTYDALKATKFWQNVADYAAKEYVAEYGSSLPWHEMFGVATRRQAAADLAESFDEIIKRNAQ